MMRWILTTILVICLLPACIKKRKTAPPEPHADNPPAAVVDEPPAPASAPAAEPAPASAPAAKPAPSPEPKNEPPAGEPKPPPNPKKIKVPFSKKNGPLLKKKLGAASQIVNLQDVGTKGSKPIKDIKDVREILAQLDLDQKLKGGRKECRAFTSFEVLDGGGKNLGKIVICSGGDDPSKRDGAYISPDNKMAWGLTIPSSQGKIKNTMGKYLEY